MNGTYKATKGSYRVTKIELTSISEVIAPAIIGQESYQATHAVEFKTQDNVTVSGQNGALRIGVSRGDYPLRNRLKAAIGLVRGKNISVYDGAPSEDAIRQSLVVQQYLADSDAFSNELGDKKAKQRVVSDKKYEVGADGVKQIPLEAMLKK